MVDYIAPIVMSCIWGVVGIIMPFFARGPSKGIIQCSLMLTGATCWLFWLCCYLAQLHPLIGPKLSQNEIYIIAREWGNPLIRDDIIATTASP